MLGFLVAASAVACHAPLPHGPAVPAPIVLSTSCGRFVLSTDGGVKRSRPRRANARRMALNWRYWGHPLTVRRNRAGRFFVLRHKRLIWRSRDVYPNDGGSIAFGPHAFAFGTYRRGVFLTDLESPERLVVRGRGIYPTDFDDAGRLIVGDGKRIHLISRSGALVRRYRYRLRNGFAFDQRTDTLYFVTPGGTLARVRGTTASPLRALPHVDGTISVDKPGLLVFYGWHDLTITRRDGALLARTSWAAPSVGPDSGVSVAPGRRRFAFRLTNARPGSRSSNAVVYVLRAGKGEAQAIYRHHLGPSGCGVGVDLNWHGRFLLYSSTDGAAVVIDTVSKHAIELGRLARLLPRRNPGEIAGAYWLSDFEADY